jgi:hypothetical protein
MTESNAGDALRVEMTLAVALAATFGASASVSRVVDGRMRVDPLPGSAFGPNQWVPESPRDSPSDAGTASGGLAPRGLP